MKDQVLVSESESDEEKKPEDPQNNGTEQVKVEIRGNSKTKEVSPSPKKKVLSKVEASSKKNDSQKMKQSSLTSFFQKKP